MTGKTPQKWLFCGDSITDGEHSRCGDPNHIMGHSFAFMAAAFLGSEFPAAQIRTYNTAQSGINTERLLSSWEKRVLSIDPDVLTLLAGINDTNTLFDEDKTPWQKNRASAKGFAENMRNMLYLAKKRNPRMRILLGVPFYFQVSGLPQYSSLQYDIEEKNFTLKIRARSQANMQEKLQDVANKQQTVKKLAEDFGALLLDFPTLFRDAARKAPIEHWIWDGVHPTVSGHMLMYKYWLHTCLSHGIFDGA